MSIEFRSFEGWLLYKGVNDDLVDEHVDPDYNADTHTFEIIAELEASYIRGLPKKPGFNRVYKEVLSAANWTIQSTKRTPELKKLRKMAKKYAEAHAKHIRKNWKNLVEV